MELDKIDKAVDGRNVPAIQVTARDTEISALGKTADRTQKPQYLILPSILPPDSPFFRMSLEAQEMINNEACAAGLHVLFAIRDKPFRNPAWTHARFVLKDDKHHMLYAEVFAAAVVGAFTAINRGEKFPNSRTSMSSNNAIIKAAEDAAHDRIKDIETRKAAKRNANNTENTNDLGDKMDIDVPSRKNANLNIDGANSRGCSTASLKREQHSTISAGDHGTTSIRPEQSKTVTAQEEREMRFTYKPPHPTPAGADPRHPSVIEFKRQTGFKNIAGTGINGKLTFHDRTRAAFDLNCLPGHLKENIMQENEKTVYRAQKAKEAAEAEKKAIEEQKLAEANQRERLRIMAASMENDSEQENDRRNTKNKSSKPPLFDPQSLIASSAAQAGPARKAKNRAVVPDSESPDSLPSKEQFDVFNDASTPLNLGARRGSRRESRMSSASAEVRENGSPMALVPPQEMHPMSKRVMRPAPSIEKIAEQLPKPLSPKQMRESTDSTEELIVPRSPAQTRPNARSKPYAEKPTSMNKSSSIQGLDKLKTKKTKKSKKSEFDFAPGSPDAAPSDDSALLYPKPKARPASLTAETPRKRGHVSDSSDSVVAESPYSKAPAAKNRPQAKQAKLRHSGMGLCSESPAASVISTAASDRPQRTKKPIRQSLPASATRGVHRMFSHHSLITASSATKKPASAKKPAVKTKIKTESPSKANTPDMGGDAVLNQRVAVTDEEYTVEAILGHKLEHGAIYYHIKWEGYSASENTWEPAGNLSDAQKVLNEYRSSLHVNGQVEDIIAHHTVQKWLSRDEGLKRHLEYLVKWKNTSKEFYSWETEERIREAGGVKPLVYYQIRNNANFGSLGWTKKKQARALQLLKDEGLEPEAGGRIAAEEMAEEDDRDELALSARGESVYDSAREDGGMNQTI